MSIGLPESWSMTGGLSGSEKYPKARTDLVLAFTMSIECRSHARIHQVVDVKVELAQLVVYDSIEWSKLVIAEESELLWCCRPRVARQC